MKFNKLNIRKFVSILLITQIHVFAIAQGTNWKQIESPLSTSVNVLHQTSHGYLFGKMSRTGENYFSSDQGASWILLQVEISDYYWVQRFTIREDHDANIYYSNKNGIFRFDPLTQQSEVYLSLPWTEDFSFLKNGNVVVATNGELLLYSSLGGLLATHKWTTQSVEILLDTLGQKHFAINSMGASDFILEFNDDLSYVSPKMSIPHDAIYRRGGRMFRRTTYSDNGTNWTNLNLPSGVPIDKYNIGMDGTLLYTSRSRLFISVNNGATFMERSLPDSFVDYISSDANGNIVISNSLAVDPKIYISEDLGQSWSFKQSVPSHPYALEFSAGIEENLYLTDLFNKSYYKENEWSPWQETTFDLLTDFMPDFHMSLSNGANISFSYDDRIFETKDKGQTWDLYSDRFFYHFSLQEIEEKSDALYSLVYNKLYYSNDFGKTWNSFLTTDQDVLNLSIFSGTYTTDNSLYVWESIFNANQIIFYNYESTEKIINPGIENAYTYASSYYDQTLYAISFEQQEVYFHYSTDRGATFTSKPNPIPGLVGDYSLKMKTDHLNNIYVHTDKYVFYSDNQGESWYNISPEFPELFKINNLKISYDNYLYLSTIGMGILKYNPQLKLPKKLIITVQEDQNENCVADSIEPALKGIKVLVNGNYLKQVNETGEAEFLVNTTVNEVQVIYNPDLYQECDPSYTIEFENSDTALHLDIPLKVLKYCADPVVGLSVPFLRRCFDNTYSGSVCNEGNIESINTEIEITLDPFFDFISATLPIKSINGQIIVLDAGHIEPGKCQSFHFVVNVSCSSDLGQEHCISAYTSTGSVDCGDATARDAYVDCQENIGAFDPNDKNIFVNGNRNQSYIEPGDKIEYLIRFQNTGTDTAFTVRIEDPITKKFNISSLKPVAASHDYTWSVNNGMLVVLFEDIQLVDSFKNEPASHGFIKFEIQLDSLTLRGDDVKNLAGIFFDFNEPIITEEVITVIGQPLNTKELSYESITAFPNPANGLVYISGNALSDKPQDLLIYDIHGKLILSQKISHHDNRIDMSKCSPGTYMLMMKSGERVYRGKLVKM